MTTELIKNFSFSLNYDFGPQNEWDLYAEYGFLIWKHLTIGMGMGIGTGTGMGMGSRF